ncbi:MAG TPA: hypothetical protein VFV54_06310, partial [Thermoanaerobaculia bacterium]|nr:hypothetical protein [Thermoanaerobaculia bacterium]
MNVRTLVVTGLTTLLIAAANASAQGAATCSDSNMNMGDRMTVRGEERLTIGGNALSVSLGEGHGLPLKVVGSARSGYEVLLCKAADNEGTLAAVRLQQKGNEISVDGPAVGDWGGHLLVLAPQNADLDIDAENGPVSISGIAGQLEARIANGPLSLKQIGGSVDVKSTNGPVSFSGGSGDVSITAENGPLTLKLESATWEGGELRASAKNGPLTVKVPDGYASGIVVERGARTPFRCPESLCGERPDFFRDDQTQIAIGTGAPRVHIASSNGPVSIKE